MPHASPSTSSVPSSESKNTTNKENPQPGTTNRNLGSNWTVSETRYLLELWRDNFPISKKRNTTVWDAIAEKLNSTFKDQGIPSYRAGAQCKARSKYLQDEYKRVKDHNSRSGNNRKSFEYYDEMYEVLDPSRTSRRKKLSNVVWLKMPTQLQSVTLKLHLNQIFQQITKAIQTWNRSSKRT